MIYCGIDWAERTHDVALVDATGALVAKRHITDDAAGYKMLLELLAEHGDSPENPIPIAIETSRGLLVSVLRNGDRKVYAINPMAAARYRDRHSVSRKKSDPGDALVLANILRTDMHAHRPLPNDSDLGRAIAVLARAQQDSLWNRQQLANQLHCCASTTRPPWRLSPRGRTAYAAPKPAKSSRPHPPPPGRHGWLVEEAPGKQMHALLIQLKAACTAADELAGAVEEAFPQHPDAEVMLSFPGLGIQLAARILAEIGDDRARFADARGLKAYAGSSPVTRASGKRASVTRRWVKNDRLNHAGYLWAFASLRACPGANAHYRRRRDHGDWHAAAQRNLFNRMIGQLYHCLQHRKLFDEHTAFPAELAEAA